MEQRLLGRTGRELSIVGLGGVVVVGLTQHEADALVGEALDRGVTYVDVAPTYGPDQEAEKRLGPALEGRRHEVFLACKTTQRHRAAAQDELHRSLQHLRTDHFDLYQLHALSTLEDVETAFGPDGAMKAFLEAREAGLIHHIGFSAHSVEAALSAMDRFDFASALFPINFVTYYEGHFGAQIIAKAQAKGAGCLALKSMARTHWKEGAPHTQPNCWYEPITDPRLADLALRFALSAPVTAAIPPGDPTLFRMALDLAEKFHPLTDAERDELRAYARTIKPLFQAAA